MLLLQKNRNPRTYFIIGQISMILGILGSRITHLDQWAGLPDIALGMISGFSGVMLAVSVVFNITALWLHRKCD